MKITERLPQVWAVVITSERSQRRGVLDLHDLRHIGEHDHAKLKDWARRNGLPYGDDSWALAWARQTIRLSRARYWCPPVDAVAGWQTENEAAESREWTNSEIAQAAPLVHDAAFQWLARFQLGESYSDLATEYASTASNVRRECMKMAALIDLPLRRASRGQPKKKRRPTPSE